MRDHKEPIMVKLQPSSMATWSAVLSRHKKILTAFRNSQPGLNRFNFIFRRPWRWSSGQRPCLLLRQSEFESRWLLNLFEKMKINEKEAGVGPSLKKLYLPRIS